jgi:hypothetical protein
MPDDSELTPGRKTARTRKRRTAAKKAALTQKRRAAGWKTAATKKAKSAITDVAAPSAKKSKALAKFQLEMDKLESRVGRGEFTSIPQILGEFNGLMDRFVPLMTDQERAMIQDIQLLGHDTGARILARRGQPVPGNDPKKPN